MHVSTGQRIRITEVMAAVCFLKCFEEEMVFLEETGFKDLPDHLDLLEVPDNENPLDLAVGGPSTPGGGRAHVHEWEALS